MSDVVAKKAPEELLKAAVSALAAASYAIQIAEEAIRQIAN
jgi:hypothetical protein